MLLRCALRLRTTDWSANETAPSYNMSEANLWHRLNSFLSKHALKCIWNKWTMRRCGVHTCLIARMCRCRWENREQSCMYNNASLMACDVTGLRILFIRGNTEATLFSEAGRAFSAHVTHSTNTISYLLADCATPFRLDYHHFKFSYLSFSSSCAKWMPKADDHLQHHMMH